MFRTSLVSVVVEVPKAFGLPKRRQRRCSGCLLFCTRHKWGGATQGVNHSGLHLPGTGHTSGIEPERHLVFCVWWVFFFPCNLGAGVGK